MSNELKPCPFCGKPAKWEKNFLQSGIARCSDYNCIGAFTHLSRSATIREWNTRPAEDALKAELEDLLYFLRFVAEDVACNSMPGLAYRINEEIKKHEQKGKINER